MEMIGSKLRSCTCVGVLIGLKVLRWDVRLAGDTWSLIEVDVPLKGFIKPGNESKNSQSYHILVIHLFVMQKNVRRCFFLVLFFLFVWLNIFRSEYFFHFCMKVLRG